MAVFGRLDIQYPDGHADSHRLEGHVVCVGRAASNAIQLQDEAIADSHFRIDVYADAVCITDLGSESGTFVSGRRLQANTPRTLRAVEEIRLGALRLTYYQRSDSPTVAMPALGEQTQPAAIDFRASLDSGEYTVFPSSSATIALEVANLSRAEAGFRVETSGLPDDWIKPERVVFPLPANESSQLQFQIKPARRSDMAPGHYPLVISITRQSADDQVLQLVANIKLGGYSGLSLALAPALCQDGGEFGVFLLNQGNQPLQLALALSDRQGQLSSELTQDRVELSPGGRRRIKGKVWARRRPMIGSAVEIPFALIARTEDPSAYTVAAPARVRVQPRWSYRAAFVAAVALIAILLVAGAVFVRAPEPEITNFELSHDQIARGTPVQLDWVAANAQRYVVEVDRSRVAELPGDNDSFALETVKYGDPIEIALIALRDETSVISTQRLDIYEPVVIAKLEANKTAMLRRVTESLIIHWDITGAVSLEISRPLGFETVRESAAIAGRGEIELRGAPDDGFEIKLVAEDEIGTVVERTISIAVKDPECVPLHDALLYAGPDKGFQQIRLAVENVPVLARGAVAGGSWLQVELASGRMGWGISSNFECRGFGTGALAVIDDPPQLPTATASATPTASPSATAAPSLAAATNTPPSSPTSVASTADS